MILFVFPVLQDVHWLNSENVPGLDFFFFPLSPAFQDINAYNGQEPTEKLPFPIIDDKSRDLAILLGMLDPAEKDEKGMPVTARVVSCRNPLVVLMTGQAPCTAECLHRLEE